MKNDKFVLSHFLQKSLKYSPTKILHNRQMKIHNVRSNPLAGFDPHILHLPDDGLQTNYLRDSGNVQHPEYWFLSSEGT